MTALFLFPVAENLYGDGIALSAKLNKLEEMLRPVIEGLGYDFWGLEFRSRGPQSMLRVFIDDAEKGISVEDCEKVSRQVSGVLDVEDPIQSEYTLEVSSPGMDRPLFRLEQYETFAGHRVQIRLRMAFEGRRKFQGLLKGIEGADVVVVVDDHEYLLPFDSIERANIVPVFE
ncbi:ribosome maturation factor RimP [Marinobacter mobilis]|uniref:Ribosome maturation factor RimP n=1 Tax=Marinobacter mobilis TaxID=488533 RepID=A0A1H2QMQ0_9GAMM|nr:ribosome maturation factor RimP [Marinobacter mobilis]